MPVVDGLPGAVLGRQVPPGTSRPGPMQHPIDHHAMVRPRPPVQSVARQQRRQSGPLLVGQIVTNHPIVSHAQHQNSDRSQRFAGHALGEPFPAQAPWSVLIAVAGVLLVARGMYRLMRTLVDLLSPRTLVGEVLWVAPWRSRRRDGDPEVVVHYLAVDDGTSDRTTAWALPSTVTRGFGPGDTVEITVRPWSRRVTALRVAQSRHLHPAHRPAVPDLAAPVAGPTTGSAPVPLL